jgi:IclR family pca regulon transcriptional regulator
VSDLGSPGSDTPVSAAHIGAGAFGAAVAAGAAIAAVVVGSRIPSYCSATGKALLAFLPRPDLDRLLSRIELIQRGPRTLTDKRALLTELDQVRHTGIAVNDEELESALRSIAAPVRSRSGEVIAAINVAIPWSPATMSELARRLGPAVQATANEIAARVI